MAPYKLIAVGPCFKFVLALQALLLLISALSALLCHWRVRPAVVRAFAWVLEMSLEIGGAASFATAG